MLLTPRPTWRTTKLPFHIVSLEPMIRPACYFSHQTPGEITRYEQQLANQLFLPAPDPVQHSHALRAQRRPEAARTPSCLAHPTSSPFRIIQADVSAPSRGRVPCVCMCAACCLLFTGSVISGAAQTNELCHPLNRKGSECRSRKFSHFLATSASPVQ